MQQDFGDVTQENQGTVDSPALRPRTMTLGEYFRQKRLNSTAELNPCARSEPPMGEAHGLVSEDWLYARRAAEDENEDASSQEMSLDSDSDSGLSLSI